ncbi:MAG: hypothetical protein ACK44V_01820, partial [Burkholderiales bacterium]
AFSSISRALSLSIMKVEKNIPYLILIVQQLNSDNPDYYKIFGSQECLMHQSTIEITGTIGCTDRAQAQTTILDVVQSITTN